MNKPEWLQNQSFSPVIELPRDYYVHDFSQGPDPLPSQFTHSIGRFNEVRKNMYTSELFTKEQRNIHMGLDIAAPVNENVYSFYDGTIFDFKHNKLDGDYGPTLVIKSSIKEHAIFALYGHLSLDSLSNKKRGQKIKSGEIIGSIGDKSINGGWFPHLHFQLSLKAPDGANMAGVVSQAQRSEALAQFLDPRWVLGPLYKD